MHYDQVRLLVGLTVQPGALVICELGSACTPERDVSGALLNAPTNLIVFMYCVWEGASSSYPDVIASRGRQQVHQLTLKHSLAFMLVFHCLCPYFSGAVGNNMLLRFSSSGTAGRVGEVRSLQFVPEMR